MMKLRWRISIHFDHHGVVNSSLLPIYYISSHIFNLFIVISLEWDSQYELSPFHLRRERECVILTMAVSRGFSFPPSLPLPFLPLPLSTYRSPFNSFSIFLLFSSVCNAATNRKKTAREVKSESCMEINRSTLISNLHRT